MIIDHLGPREVELVQMLTIGMGWNEDDHHLNHLDHLDPREVELVQV